MPVHRSHAGVHTTATSEDCVRGPERNPKRGATMKYASIEYVLRVWKLMESPRSMTLKAASTVVQAAMFGDGCIEGTVRKRIEEEQRGTDTRTGNR